MPTILSRHFPERNTLFLSTFFHQRVRPALFEVVCCNHRHPPNLDAIRASPVAPAATGIALRDLALTVLFRAFTRALFYRLRRVRAVSAGRPDTINQSQSGMCIC